MTGARYRLLFLCIAPLIKLVMYYRLWRGKEERGRLSERYGRGYQHQRPTGKLVWLHAVSVGEAVAARHLCEHLRQHVPDCHFLITTNTVTAAQRVASYPLSCHAYQPIDHPQWVGRFLDYWRPDAAIMLESDFWPQLITATAAKNIPLLFASAQLSRQSAQKWLKHPEFAAEIFSTPQMIFCVDNQQKEIFERLTFLAEPAARPQIITSGSLKLAPQHLEAEPAFTAQIRQAAGTRMIIAACSTHDTEEALILDACQGLLEQHRLLLLLAPRHPHRADMLAQQISDVARRSLSKYPTAEDSIFLCDQMGEMDSLYQAADLLIMGGSFVDVGGHNLIEPARSLTPILTGPYDEKNAAEKQALSATAIVTCVEDKEALSTAIDQFYRRFEQNETLLDEDIRAATQAYLKTRYAEAEKIAYTISQTLL